MVGKYYQFVDIFETTVLEGSGQKLIVGDLKIELLPSLPRTFVVPVFGAPVVARGRGAELARPFVLRLDAPRRFVILTARTLEPNPPLARRVCEALVDRGVTLLSTLIGSSIFARRTYRGWIDDGDKVIVEMDFRGAAPTRIPLARLASELKEMEHELQLDQDTFRRYSIMSGFYSKAILAQLSEEHFLYLWTILEIFPMKDATDIRPISEFLAGLTGKSASEIKNKLGIGQLFGARSNLVHNGELGLELKQLSQAIAKLDAMCAEVLGALAGRPYSGKLDRYL